MTRGMNMGKPRAPHPKDAITTPVLHYTSAVQRNDLYSHSVSTNHTQASHEAMSLWDFQRPRTSEARARNKKHPNLRIKIPPLDGVPTPIHTGETNGNTIGIALGSPRMIDRRNGIPQLRQQDPFAAPAENPNRAPAIQRKPSKWRKIGGLFKAKNSMNPTTANRPFYKVRNNSPPPGSSHSIDSQSHAEAGREPNSLSPGDDEKGNCFGEIKTCLEAKRKLKKTDSKRRPKTAAAQGSHEPKVPDTVPFLEVEIPDTQMERYSVMFGGLLGQGKPALLARRSKTMDSLNKESSKSPLEPPRPRRATSPTRSKSPSFTLFPTMQTNKASKILGTSNIPRGPSPLLRSQTAPTEQEQEHQHLLNDINSPMTPRSGFSPMPTPNGSHRNLAQTTNGLGINIEIPPPHSPHGHARNDSTASSPLLSPLSATKTRISSMLSPAARRNNPPASRTESTLIDTENNDTTPNDTNNNDRKQATTSVDSTTEPFPNIEISVARSVSVSKGKKKQVVVPVGPKSDRLVPEMGSGGSQRKGKGKTPKVMDAHHGHRHGNSHDVRIENAD